MLANRWIAPLLVLAILSGMVPLKRALEQSLMARQEAAAEKHPFEPFLLPPPTVLKAISFGYSELVADLLWVRTIAYFADHLTTDRDMRHLYRYLEMILAFDDKFQAVYRYGPAMILSHEKTTSQEERNQTALRAIALLERGHNNFPEEYRFPFNIGAYYLGELRTKDKQKRDRWKRQAADWIRRAALIGSDLPWLPSLAARIYSEQGERELAIHHLKELYLTSQDEKMKQQIAAKLKQLQAKKLTEELRQAAADFDKAYDQSEINFVPADLFVLLRQRPVGPFSLRDLFSSEQAPPDQSSGSPQQ